METATEGSDLLCTLQIKSQKKSKNVDLKNDSQSTTEVLKSDNSNGDSTLNIIAQAPPSTHGCAQIHDCAESEPGKRQLYKKYPLH